MAEMAGMSELSEMSKEYIWATRHATVHSMPEMSKKAKMFKMSNMTTRHVMRSLESSAV
jgi:hypothetical protein